MKQGATLPELAQEIHRQATAKTDYLVDTRLLTMDALGEWPKLTLDGRPGDYGITELAHRQIGERLSIPAKYYDRMLDSAPLLLEWNVNHWFSHNSEKRLIRTLDGKVRAFLSDRYHPLDNFDLAEAVLPTLAAAGATIHSCQITENKLYIKGVVDAVQRTVLAPDGGTGHGNRHSVTVSPGIVITNSEVGLGALTVQPAIHTLACTNMAIWAQSALRKYHVGRKQVGSGGNDGNFGEGSDEGIWQYMSDETKQLSDAALWSQVKDLTVAALQGDLFDDIVRQLQAARGDTIDHPIEAVETLSTKRSLSDGEHEGVLNYLVAGGELSRYGLSNAVTRFSQDVESYDRATFFELLGGEMIALPKNDWQSLISLN